MDHVTSTDVLVTGAGPVGLSLALVLARAGVDCRVIEREPEFRDRGVRGKGLSPRTLEIFDDFGILDAIYAKAELNPKVRTYQGSTLVHEVDPAPANQPTPDRPRLGVVILPQHDTEAALRARLAEFGHTVDLATELTGHTQEADHMLATVRTSTGTEQIRARYLVGCDGGRSVVRKLTGIPFLGETWEQEHFLLGSVDIDGLAPDSLHVWGSAEHGAGALILVPLSHGQHWAFHARLTPDEAEALAAPTLVDFQRLFQARSELPGTRLHSVDWSSVWRPNVRMVQSYRDGRVFLAGDAAHVHSASGGQGMNTGIQDAYNLGWKLASVLRGGPAELLDTYQAERLPVAARVLAATSAQHAAVMDAVKGVDKLVEQMRFSAEAAEFTQLGISYRGGPLAIDHGDDRLTVRAGDRAPDAPGLLPGTGPARLFDLFRGPHATLLVFGTAALGLPEGPGLRIVHIAPEGSFVDTDGHVRRAYGWAENAIILVRPDGYIALTGDVTDPQLAETVHHLTGHRRAGTLTARAGR